MNPGQNLFGATRLSDGSHFGRADQGKRILYVRWRPEAERNEPHKFLRNQANGKQVQVNFYFWFQPVEGNEAHFNFGGLLLGEKNSVIGLREIT